MVHRRKAPHRLHTRRKAISPASRRTTASKACPFQDRCPLQASGIAPVRAGAFQGIPAASSAPGYWRMARGTGPSEYSSSAGHRAPHPPRVISQSRCDGGAETCGRSNLLKKLLRPIRRSATTMTPEGPWITPLFSFFAARDPSPPDCPRQPPHRLGEHAYMTLCDFGLGGIFPMATDRL